MKYTVYYKSIEMLKHEVEADSIEEAEKLASEEAEYGDLESVDSWMDHDRTEYITYHVGKGEKIEPKNVFVVLHGSEKSCNNGMIMTYSPIGQHGEASLDYVKESKEITKKQFLAVSEGIYTPQEYL